MSDVMGSCRPMHIRLRNSSRYYLYLLMAYSTGFAVASSRSLTSKENDYSSSLMVGRVSHIGTIEPCRSQGAARSHFSCLRLLMKSSTFSAEGSSWPTPHTSHLLLERD
jgi:hypothetical protein